MKDYHINISYSDGDKCYIADIPDLEHCSACGETADEAFKEIKNAKNSGLNLQRKSVKKFLNPDISLFIIKLFN